MVKQEILDIKNENPTDYKLLLIAAHEYTVNKESKTPNKILERSMLAIITEILDKYGVKYENDLC